MVPWQDWVLPWHTLIRQSMFSHLLEVEFFPKWLDVLYIWLIQPSYKANEVATWYVFPSYFIAVVDKFSSHLGTSGGVNASLKRCATCLVSSEVLRVVSTLCKKLWTSVPMQPRSSGNPNLSRARPRKCSNLQRPLSFASPSLLVPLPPTSHLDPLQKTTPHSTISSSYPRVDHTVRLENHCSRCAKTWKVEGVSQYILGSMPCLRTWMMESSERYRWRTWSKRHLRSC